MAGVWIQEIEISDSSSEIDAVFGRCDGWYRPWCIRATTGHSDFGFMSSSALANRYSARMGALEEHSM